MPDSIAKDDCMFIGNKPFMNYVSAIVMRFTTRNEQTVVLRSRGKYIVNAVDVSQIACRKFLEGIVEVKSVTIGSDALTTPEGKAVNVSTIEITLGKK